MPDGQVVPGGYTEPKRTSVTLTYLKKGPVTVPYTYFVVFDGNVPAVDNCAIKYDPVDSATLYIELELTTKHQLLPPLAGNPVPKQYLVNALVPGPPLDAGFAGGATGRG